MSANNNNSDCLSCKLVSFTGLTISGIYVAHHARKQPSIFGKGVLGIFSFGLIYTGTARLLNLYPFTEKRHKTARGAEQNNG